jgi:hypothetical protein
LNFEKSIRLVEKKEGVTKQGTQPRSQPSAPVNMTIVEPREIPLWKLGAVLLPVITAVGVPATSDPVHYEAVYASVVCSTIAFAVTIYAIPKLGPSFVKVGLKGRDLLKVSTDDVSVNINNLHSLHASNASSIGQNAWASSVRAYTYAF